MENEEEIEEEEKAPVNGMLERRDYLLSGIVFFCILSMLGIVGLEYLDGAPLENASKIIDNLMMITMTIVGGQFALSRAQR